MLRPLQLISVFDEHGGTMENESSAEPAQPFFAVGLVQLLLLGIATFGLYQLHWFLMHWRHLRDCRGERVSPAIRGILFAGVFIFPLAYRFGKVARSRAVGSPVVTLLLATVWLVLSLAILLTRAPVPVTLVPLVPLAGLQAVVNRTNRTLSPGHNPNARLTVGNWVLVAIGGLLMLLVTLVTALPPQPPGM